MGNAIGRMRGGAGVETQGSTDVKSGVSAGVVMKEGEVGGRARS